MFSLRWLSVSILAAMLQRLGDEWVPISSETLGQRVTAVARALRKWGVGKGDRVAILSENRPEWTIADFASLLLGAVTVPIYATLTAEQTAYILRDSGARVVFLSSEAQLQKVLAIREQDGAGEAGGHGPGRGRRRGAYGRHGDRRPASPRRGLGIRRWKRRLARFHPRTWPPLSILRARPERPRE